LGLLICIQLALHQPVTKPNLLYRDECVKPECPASGAIDGRNNLADWLSVSDLASDSVALVAGNCSAFVPWQITEGRESIHALMVMSDYTPKTYTAMHYMKFIRPGAQRIDAEPGFAAVQVGAFLHEKDGDLTVVALNPTEQDQPLNLAFRNLKGLASLKVYRTSASESLKEVGDVPVNGDKAVFPMTPQSIVTLSGRVSRR
jgi:glucuronoarabinoxylan endo-1,4-beta-xylanase